MSNELEVFKNSKPAAAFTGEPVESLAEGIGSSYGVIHYKGKVWSLRYRGEQYTFTRADDGTPVGHIDVIILGKGKQKSKSYYEAYDQNATGGRPICASIDGVVPDDDVTKQQSVACGICPRNVWKTNAEGRKSRECSDYMRLAVLLLPTQTKLAIGSALMEPVFLRVPPASLNNLAVFGETMTGQGWPFHSFVTRIRFNPDVAHPEMVFSALQALTDAEGPVINPLRKDALTLRITGGDQAPRQPAAALAAPAAAPAAPAPVTATVTAPAPAPAPKPVEPTTVDTGLTGMPSKDTLIKLVEPPPPKVMTLAETVQAQGSVLDLTANAPAAPAPQAAPQTVADTGEPEESDAALDARISGLLKI